MKHSILEGVKILDLTRVLAGPWCTQALADMGARVFKIERPGNGDEMRQSPPFLKDTEGNRTTYTPAYVSVNRGKQSLTIDFTQDAGRRLVLELAAQCDVFVENFKVGDLKRYGLDYEAVRAINPRIVYCSITGYGQDGPMARYPGYDPILQGVSGIMSTCGLPEGQPGAGPLRSMVPLIDVMTGMISTSSVLAALYHQQRTGEGQCIDVALLDVAMSATSYLSQNFLLTGQVAARIGNGSRLFAPSNCYQCADGPLLIQIGNDGQWEKLCKALKRETWLSDPRFASNGARLEHVLELDREITAVTSGLKRHDVTAWLSDMGVPCGPVNTIAEAYDHPQVVHRGLRAEVEHPELGKIPVVRSPFRFSHTPVEHRPPPGLGAHTASVLASELAIPAEQLRELAEAGVI
ncbi:CaiB/BaiF CoA transferase family protein [Paraburkholderia acidisoli]|uniref:CoA transferase n=1 Tax=Paraburkholderia acidisoli TaxID=2571748 RepID=A0A7Z2GKA1_9BURK|nr:CoA transferase [Paraburkholderia acidisoli]QGZ63357.1 CoA transferase [Paraburkholderia acidisoli]